MQVQSIPIPQMTEAVVAVDEDTALVQRAATADISAFEQLYRRHHRRVHGVIVRLVGQARARKI